MRHLHRLAMPPPVFEFRRRNGINVLVILQIMWSLPLFGVMTFRVLVQIIHRYFVMPVSVLRVINSLILLRFISLLYLLN